MLINSNTRSTNNNVMCMHDIIYDIDSLSLFLFNSTLHVHVPRTETDCAILAVQYKKYGNYLQGNP